MTSCLLKLVLTLCLALGFLKDVRSVENEIAYTTFKTHELQIKGDVNSDDIIGYGVDVSYPMHHVNVTENYPWLPHNVDPNIATPPVYSAMPLQPLGDRQKFYNNLLQNCEEHFNKNFKGRGDRCRESEHLRIKMALRQPRSMQNYTQMGFEKIRAPEKVFKLINDFWAANKMNSTTEVWSIGDMLTNSWQVPTSVVDISRPDLRGGGEPLMRQIWDAARESIQSWTGEQLQPSSVYGIRIYRGGAVLAPHVDRLPLVSSAIINVDQDVDEPWPLEVIDHDGNAHNITMQPGDMVLYESHSVLHGRPFQLQGRFVANLFIHFEPVDSLQESSVVQDYDDKLTNLPKYILPESPEAARIKARPWNRGAAGTFTTAHDAATANDVGTLQKVLSEEQNLLHARDEKGWTPLHVAARLGHLDVVKYLVELGADVNSRTRNHDGATVLWWAATYIGDDHPVVEFLKSRGAVMMGAEF